MNSEPPARVPAEFVGLARALRSRIADAVAINVVRDTSQQLIDRRRRHPVPRADILAGVARAWRQVLALGRADRQIKLERKSLSMVATRMCPQYYRQAEWEEDALEPGLIVVRVSLAIAPHENAIAGNAHARRYFVARSRAPLSAPTAGH